MKYAEYIAINERTRKVELVELTDVMAENLSELATVVSVETIGGKATVWRNRKPRVIAVDGSAVAELKRRAVWREEHAGMLS